MPGKTLPQEFADLAESFRSIAERSDALPSELKHAQERGGRLVDAAYRAGLIADESGLLEATQHLREPKHKDDEESRNWGTFWSLFVLNLSRIYRPGCSDPLAIGWGPESDGVRTGTTRTDEWRIRARNFAYVAGWLAAGLTEAGNQAAPADAAALEDPADGQPQGDGDQARYSTPDNFERDKWIYGQHMAGKKIPEIREGLEQNAHARDWYPVTCDNGIRECWRRYAKQHGLPLKKARSGPKR